MSSKKVVSLYRLLLQNARKIDQYNFRSWCIRKVKEDFHISKGLLGDEAAKKISYGQEQLEIVKRYALISHMYADDASVMSKK